MNDTPDSFIRPTDYGVVNVVESPFSPPLLYVTHTTNHVGRSSRHPLKKQGI